MIVLLTKNTRKTSWSCVGLQDFKIINGGSWILPSMFFSSIFWMWCNRKLGRKLLVKSARLACCVHFFCSKKAVEWKQLLHYDIVNSPNLSILKHRQSFDVLRFIELQQGVALGVVIGPASPPPPAQLIIDCVHFLFIFVAGYEQYCR